MGSLENPFVREGEWWSQIYIYIYIYRVELPKTGWLGQFADLREAT